MASQTKKITVTLFIFGSLLYFLSSMKEIGNFYQTGHAGFINAEVGLSHLNTINNGFIKTKFGATNYRVIHDRAPTVDEYYVRYPYLHNLLVSALWKITGPSEIATRLFMIILVFASIVVMARVSKEMGYPPLATSLVFFTLCCLPVFYHYSGLSNGEISSLLTLSLALLAYVKINREKSPEHRILFLIFLSLSCQLFWYGYIAALVFFLDALLASVFNKDKASARMSVWIPIAVAVNLAVYILHTVWLVGSIDRVVGAFLWRSGLKVPETQQFTLIDFVIKNLKRWWLLNPVAIVLAAAFLVTLLLGKKRLRGQTLNVRILIILLLAPIIFMIVLSHLVQYHDFLIIYFSPFLALASASLISRSLDTLGPHKRGLLLGSIIALMVIFAIFGLFKEPEEKLIDKETNNYELYYVLKVVRNLTQPGDRFLITIKRVQEPQVSFYLRRDAYFNKVLPWAKGYIDSGKFNYYLVENKLLYRPLIKYLLQNYRGYKFDRYFLFSVDKSGTGLQVFHRTTEETDCLYKYFVSPHHQPGGFEDVTNSRILEQINERYSRVRDLEFN